jgi:adenine-specific DNA-methyltransferase
MVNVMTKDDQERQRRALEALGRERLAAVTESLGLAVADKRKAAGHVDAVLDSGRMSDALAALKRDDLKAMCRAVSLDDSGKEKEPIAARLARWFQTGDAAFPLDATTANEPKKPGRASKPKNEALALDDVAADYRHEDAKRKNNPPAGLVEFDKPPPRRKREYAYDPHLDPQLQWAGKAEHTSFEVDTVSLHIHERVSTQAILRAVKRDEAEPQLNLFARPELPAAKEVDFYSHDVGWSNRLILGDSLIVMNSLLERENMAGQVQCTIIDPPYGVKFNSNFQPSLSRRDVKDGDDGSLTREPEQIQAYRDTWELGLHSYLSYLRDRLLLTRELLAPSGSLFVQISDENLHHVRELVDEVFGAENFLGVVIFTKTTGATVRYLPSTADYLIWVGRDAKQTKYRPLFLAKSSETEGSQYTRLRFDDGTKRPMTAEEKRDASLTPKNARIYGLDNLTSQSIGRDKGEGAACWFPVPLGAQTFLPSAQSRWKTNEEGMRRLAKADRLEPSGNTLRYVRYLHDFPVSPLTNFWSDTTIAGFASDKQYVVETSAKVFARCILMATDPGDLVFDPTCGSGTTAVVAEQWGRRWITCDTSRVALALARQRLLTTKHPYYRLRSGRVKDGFVYKSVPHVTLKSIAQNPKIDECATRAEIEAVIARDAEQATLYDQPIDDKNRIRVTGPFTVEAIPLASMEDPTRDVDGADSRAAAVAGHFSDATTQYLSMMMDLLRQTGVNFPGNKKLRLPSLRAMKGETEWFHAEGNSDAPGDPRVFAVSFGPRHGAITPTQVLGAIRETRGHDHVLFVGFACDPEARKMIDEGVPGRELHYAAAAPDILVGDLLKKKRTDQLFAVYGAPDVKIHSENGGSLVSVELVGVDLYDPNTGETRSAKGTDAAALFVDHDYDGKSFCISQALFPGGSNPWEKLQKALKGQIDEEKFAALQSARSLPFKPGNKVAVKVIDDRGNEVIKIVDARKALKK